MKVQSSVAYLLFPVTYERNLKTTQSIDHYWFQFVHLTCLMKLLTPCFRCS